MKIKPILFAFALFAIGPLALPAYPQDEPKPTNLRPKWEQGQSARYEFWSKSTKKDSATIGGQTQDKTTTYVTEGEISWKVDAFHDDGTASCTMLLNKIKFTIQSPEGEPVIIESENPDEQHGVLTNLITAMTTVPIKVEVNSDGSIASVSGVDKMRETAGQDAQDADIVPEAIDFIENASELATLINAPARATPGQTWNSKNSWNHDSVIPGTDTVGKWDTTFTYDSRTSITGIPIATIKSSSDIDLQVDLSKMPEQAPDVDVQINDASAKAEILFDLSRNETVARNDSMVYHATITVTPPTNRIPPIKINVTETNHSQLLRIAEQSDPQP